MILVDSSVWIDYFNGVPNRTTDILDNELGNQLIITGDLIVLEVLQGFSKDRDYRLGKSLMETLPHFSLCNRELAIQAAMNYRLLRRKGVTVRKTIDMVIATFCIENQLPLLQNDKDFIPMQVHLGLELV